VYKAILSGQSQVNLVQFIVDSKEFRFHSYNGMEQLAVHSVKSKQKNKYRKELLFSFETKKNVVTHPVKDYNKKLTYEYNSSPSSGRSQDSVEEVTDRIESTSDSSGRSTLGGS
jgi:hypothetical protein